MNKAITIIMYVLWIATIIALLCTTFTQLRYEDLNMIALVLLAFTTVNSFLFLGRNKPPEKDKSP